MWITTVAITLLMLVLIESGLRRQGHRASIVDDRDNWSLQRAEASKDDPRTIAVLGTSRMQLAFDADTFRLLLPGWRLANLSVDGKAPLATLHDLAMDARFRGVVLCDLTGEHLSPVMLNAQQAHVDHYHKTFRFDRAFVRGCANHIQSNLALVHPQVRVSAWLEGMITGQWPRPLYVVMQDDRQRRADFSMADVAELRDKRRAYLRTRHAYGPGDWASGLARLREDVARINSRGGAVVFVHLPVSGPVKANEDRLYPRQDYWDVIASQPGVFALHDDDLAMLAGMRTPDYSHIDERDMALFTRTILDELLRRGIFER